MDFSSLVLGSGEITYYKNIVDSQFQYKGTLCCPSRTGANQSFWTIRKRIKKVADFYFSLGASAPFSIDSYLYLEEGEVKLCLLSEVNVRKTMGLCRLEPKQAL